MECQLQLIYASFYKYNNFSIKQMQEHIKFNFKILINLNDIIIAFKYAVIRYKITSGDTTRDLDFLYRNLNQNIISNDFVFQLTYNILNSPHPYKILICEIPNIGLCGDSRCNSAHTPDECKITDFLVKQNIYSTEYQKDKFFAGNYKDLKNNIYNKKKFYNKDIYDNTIISYKREINKICNENEKICNENENLNKQLINLNNKNKQLVEQEQKKIIFKLHNEFKKLNEQLLIKSNCSENLSKTMKLKDDENKNLNEQLIQQNNENKNLNNQLIKQDVLKDIKHYKKEIYLTGFYNIQVNNLKKTDHFPAF